MSAQKRGRAEWYVEIVFRNPPSPDEVVRRVGPWSLEKAGRVQSDTDLTLASNQFTRIVNDGWQGDDIK